MHKEILLLKKVEDLFKNKLPQNYCYHNIEHTLYVKEKVVEIGKAENCTEKELHLLSSAALLHDAGYIYKYKGHEEESCKIAEQLLPDLGYTNYEILEINRLIRATKITEKPKNKLEKIIADADLEYLGTENAEQISEKFFLELKTQNKDLNRKEWNKIQCEFISQHQYHTQYCQKTKEPLKQLYLKKLLKL